MSHTPTPWRVQEHAWWQITQADALPGSTAIATTHEDVHVDRDSYEAQANAEFIVRAANSHEELLEAAKMAFGIIGESEVGVEAENETLDALEAAITKAERSQA